MCVGWVRGGGGELPLCSRDYPGAWRGQSIKQPLYKLVHKVCVCVCVCVCVWGGGGGGGGESSFSKA